MDATIVKSFTSEKAIFKTDFKSIIDAWDFNLIKKRLCQVSGWTMLQAEEACLQYKNYIYILAKYPNKILPPSHDIDEVWHAHILHTKDYINFSRQVFGHYLHHQPELSESKTTGSFDVYFEQLRLLYKKEFSMELYEVVGKSTVMLRLCSMRNKVKGLMNRAVLHLIRRFE